VFALIFVVAVIRRRFGRHVGTVSCETIDAREVVLEVEAGTREK
jgi:hypothetical protein